MNPLAALLADEHLEASARVMLTTVFGDALRPRRARAGVQQLSAIMDPLGVNDRAVRTALHRLSTDGLVAAEREGRQSFYAVAPEADATFEQGEARIYGASAPDWDGEWTVVIADEPNSDSRTALGRALGWAGYRQLHSSVWLSPTADPTVAIDEAARLNAPLAAVTRGPLRDGSWATGRRGRDLLDPHGDLEALYLRHLRAFDGGEMWGDLDPATALSIRVLLITNWRRLALRTPAVPTALIPDDWPGADARALTIATYNALLGSSESRLDELLGPHQATADGRWA